MNKEDLPKIRKNKESRRSGSPDNNVKTRNATGNCTVRFDSFHKTFPGYIATLELNQFKNPELRHRSSIDAFFNKLPNAHFAVSINE